MRTHTLRNGFVTVKDLSRHESRLIVTALEHYAAYCKDKIPLANTWHYAEHMAEQIDAARKRT